MSFEEILKTVYYLSDDSVACLMGEMERVSYLKKECVLREGQWDDFVYFVESGSVRRYVLRGEKNVILSFVFEGDMAVAVPGFSGRTVSKCIVETLEDSILLRISRERLEGLFRKSLELANWGRCLVERYLLEHELYFMDYFWTDKGTQYRNLIKEYPQLLQRVSLKELASYLDVTPQSLSRIRAERK